MLPLQGTIPDWKTKIPPAPHGGQKLINKKVCARFTLKKKKNCWYRPTAYNVAAHENHWGFLKTPFIQCPASKPIKS